MAINEPLRNTEEGVEHPLPVLVTILEKALRKLRQIGSKDMVLVSKLLMWRGMKNLKPSDVFNPKRLAEGRKSLMVFCLSYR